MVSDRAMAARIHLVLAIVTLLVGILFVTATRVRSALDIVPAFAVEAHLFFTLALPLGHLLLYRDLRHSPQRAQVSASGTRWSTLALALLHVVWGSGLVWGPRNAWAIGIGLLILDTYTLYLLTRSAREGSVDHESSS